MADVRSKLGAPITSDFDSHTGTPIVCNQTTGGISVLKADNTIQEMALVSGSSAQDFTARQFISTIVTGTPPLVVASTTEVANLRSATTTILATPRIISGTSFNGAADITLPGIPVYDASTGQTVNTLITTDPNTIIQAGVYNLYNSPSLNTPAGFGTFGFLTVTRHYATGAVSVYVNQSLTEMFGTKTYTRSGTPGGSYTNTVWTPWVYSLQSPSPSAGIGYIVGAGGSVTQLTSKTTSVLLNKPTGLIIMNNAALAAGATISFQFVNSTVLIDDVIIINVVWDAIASPISYSVRAASYDIANGTILVVVKNETAGSLSDIVQLKFSILRGSRT